MAIDPKKILVVYNTSNAQSLANADYYAVARSLGVNTAGYYRLGVPFTAASSLGWPTGNAAGGAKELVCAASQRPGGILNEAAYVGQRFIDAIRAMVANNGIEAVLFESLCPKSAIATSITGPFEAYVTDSAAGYDPGSVTYSMLSRVFETPIVGGGNTYQVTPWPVLFPLLSVKKLTGFQLLPWGRIGYWGCAPADIVRIVTDALWAESQDNTAKLHIVGGVSYNSINHKVNDDITAHKLFNQAGYNVAHFDVDAAYPEYSASTLNFTSFTGGVLPISPFALSISSPAGNDYASFQAGGFVYNNYTPQRGSWGLWWASFASNFGEMALKRVGANGSTAVGVFATVAEPYDVGLPKHAVLAACLLSGASLMEALWAGRNNGSNTTVLGDPLYRPYLASKLNRFNTSTLGA